MNELARQINLGWRRHGFVEAPWDPSSPARGLDRAGPADIRGLARAASTATVPIHGGSRPRAKEVKRRANQSCTAH
jgi:hypothetical protein